MSCLSKDAVLSTGSGGGGGTGSGGQSASGGAGALGGHLGTGGISSGGQVGAGGLGSGGQVGSGGLGGGGHAGSAGSGGAEQGGKVGSGGAGGGGQTGSAGSGSGGLGGQPSNDGGTDAFMCEHAECARPYACVRACGGAVEYTGCCQCVAPLFDNYNNLGCRGTGGAGGQGGAGGNGGAGGASCAQIQTGYAAALQTAKVCNEAISSRYPCATAVKATLGCTCMTFVDDASGLKPYQDAWTMAGCSSVCVLGCITLQEKGTCDSPSTTTSEGICKDAPL